MSVQPKSLTVFRHGQSLGNKIFEEANFDPMFSQELEAMTGDPHFELTDAGKKQVEALRDFVRKTNKSFDVRFVSQYTRARQTYNIVFPDNPPDEVRSDLNEYSRGHEWLFPGTICDVSQREKKSFELKGENHHRPIGGENQADFDLRVRIFLQSLSLYHADEDVAVVGHSLWGKTCFALCERIDPEDFHMPYASSLRFERSECGKRLRFKSLVTPWQMKL